MQLEIISQDAKPGLVYYRSPLERLANEILGLIVQTLADELEDIKAIIQVCRRVRDVAFGMPCLWNRITLLGKDMYQNTSGYFCDYGKAHCIPKSALRPVLKRARWIPLDLEVQWPVADETLELIGSTHAPINTLEVYDTLYMDVDVGRFESLNLSSLSTLRFGTLKYEEIDQIMDLADETECDKVTLHLNMALAETEWHPAFTHPFIQRVVTLRIQFDIDYVVFKPNLEAVNGHFPWIKSWKIEGPPPALWLLDLSHADELEFYCQTGIHYFQPKLIPTQLTELTLAGVFFVTDKVPAPVVRSMANLRRLTLFDLELDRPLRYYLTFPNLKYLQMNALAFRPANVAKGKGELSIDKLCDGASSEASQN